MLTGLVGRLPSVTKRWYTVLHRVDHCGRLGIYVSLAVDVFKPLGSGRPAGTADRLPRINTSFCDGVPGLDSTWRVLPYRHLKGWSWLTVEGASICPDFGRETFAGSGR